MALAAGGHTLGVSAGGDVYVWGRNSSDGGGGHGSAPVPDSDDGPGSPEALT